MLVQGHRGRSSSPAWPLPQTLTHSICRINQSPKANNCFNKLP